MQKLVSSSLTVCASIAMQKISFFKEAYMRKLRELVPGGTYHVSARINNRELHLQEVLCKSIMLEIMEKLQTEMGFKFEHFAIMDNHVHFIISTLDMELPKIMQRLLMTYTIRYNKAMKRTGHIWGDRYFSRVLRTQNDVEQCFEYLNQNPVKAELVKNELSWPWSSLAFYRFAPDFVSRWMSPWSVDLHMKAISKLQKGQTLRQKEITKKVIFNVTMQIKMKKHKRKHKK